MANASIPGLPPAILLDGTEQIEIVQPPGSGGTTKRATLSQVVGLGGVFNNTLPPQSIVGNPAFSTAPVTAIVSLPNQALLTDASGRLAFGAISLLTGVVTGILPVSLGGTGDSSVTANGVLLGNGTGALSSVAPVTSGYVLTSNGTGSAPSYQLGGGLANQPGLSVLGVTANATGAPAAIIGTAGQVLRVADSGTTLAFGQVDLGTSAAVTGFLALTNITAIAALSVLGNGSSGAGNVTALVGTANQILQVNPAGTGLAFGLLNLTAAVTGIITVPHGGTGTSALAAHGLLIGNGAGVVTISAVGAAGQALIGQTGADPTWNTVSGDITLAANGAATIAANAVTFAKFQTMVPLSVHGNSSSATTNSVAIAGTANQVLVVNSAGTGLAFGSLLTASLTGILAVPGGGTGTSALTAHAVLIGNGAGVVTLSAVPTAGQILVGQTTTSDPTWNTMSGDVTMANTGAATIANNAVTFAKFQTMAALSVHANSSSAVTNSLALSGTANQVLIVNPAGTALIFGQLNLSATGAVTGVLPLTTNVTGILPIANGGTNASVAATAIVNLGGLALATTGQAFSGGVVLTTLNLGTAAGSTATLVAGNNPTQRIAINGTAAFVAPSSDCEIDLLVTNAASASTISFSGYSVGANTGDTYTTTSGNKFIFMSRTINGSSTYAWKALQ